MLLVWKLIRTHPRVPEEDVLWNLRKVAKMPFLLGPSTMTSWFPNPNAHESSGGTSKKYGSWTYSDFTS